MSRSQTATRKLILPIVATLASSVLMVVGVSGCGATTVIHQTVIAYATVSLSTVTATVPSTTSSPPPGIWCPVKEGQMPLTSACEIYPSPPQISTPPQSESVLAGTPDGPQIGSTGATSATQSMQGPLWAADVICSTKDDSNNGEVQILMVAHTSGGDYYSWGDESCGPPSAPNYGNEFFREATDSITLSIQPLTGNLLSWTAQFLQL